MWVACYCGAALLGVRLLHVQVIRNVYYSRVAESNRTQIIPQTAPRGRIYDRDKRVVATNKPAFSLIYLPARAKALTGPVGLANSLAREMRREPEPILNKLNEAHREKSAVVLAENLPLKAMFKLSELKTIYPGVELIVEARRHYPFGGFAGHLLGYMGKMDRRSWRRLKHRGYRVDSWIGRAGLETRFEERLRGIQGEIRMEADAQGRLKRKLDQIAWEPGANLHLTLNANIQKAVEEGLRASPSGLGAAVVLDPRNGEILALASIPDYDPNMFLLPEWDRPKQEIKNLPEFNRAISGTYAPASTFKIIVSAAMFEEARIDPKERIFCPGKFRLGNRTFRCWEKKGHKRMDYVQGLSHSCDVYYYQMGLRVGGHLIERYAKMFGMGKKTNIKLLGEKPGLLFGPKSRRAQKKGWYDGDTVNQSIGQGEFLMSPLQSAVFISAVANRGTLWRPYFVREIEYPGGRVESVEEPKVNATVELKDETWDLIYKGLRSVVTSGTGRRVNIRELEVYGKTGTAENPRGEDHAWFVAFANRPGEEPSVAVSVLVEHGGHGSSAAGPIARRALEAAFGIERKKPAPRIPAGVPAPTAPTMSRPGLAPGARR